MSLQISPFLNCFPPGSSQSVTWLFDKFLLEVFDQRKIFGHDRLALPVTRHMGRPRQMLGDVALCSPLKELQGLTANTDAICLLLRQLFLYQVAKAGSWDQKLRTSRTAQTVDLSFDLPDIGTSFQRTTQGRTCRPVLLHRLSGLGLQGWIRIFFWVWLYAGFEINASIVLWPRHPQTKNTKKKLFEIRKVFFGFPKPLN